MKPAFHLEFYGSAAANVVSCRE